MKTIEIAYRAFAKERFPLPSEEQVADVERRIGVLLPSDYSEFLLEYNGAFLTEPRITPPTSECPLDRLTCMHGIGATHHAGELVSGSYPPALFDDNYPVQVLPIGHTMMGNLILLVTREEDRGCILLKKAFSQDYFFLAEGIEEFFGLLREPEDESP